MKWGVDMKLSLVAESMRASSTLSISAEANRKIAEGVDIINFSAGEPDFNTPENIKDAAKAALDNNFTHYTPYEGIEELRRAIADDLKKQCGLEYDVDQIVISNGSKHAILNAFKAILDPKDEVLVPAPYWNSYIDIIKMCYGVPVVVNTKKGNGFKVKPEQLEAALTDKTKALIINSPNNPSGMMYSEEELKEIADFAVKHDLYVISDELYKKLVYSKKLRHVSIASLGEDIYSRTIVVDGLSKSYAMTGWRVGYTASNKEVAVAIANIQSNTTSNINSIAQAAALEALTGDQTEVENMIKEFEHRRDYIAQRISDIPLLSSLLPKGAFYLFVDVSKLYGGKVRDIEINSSEDVAKALMQYYNVAVVPSSAFGYPDYIRISYATSMRDVVEGSNRIERFIKDNF
jgi:aspartate aminotransferase